MCNGALNVARNERMGNMAIGYAMSDAGGAARRDYITVRVMLKSGAEVEHAIVTHGDKDIGINILNSVGNAIRNGDAAVMLQDEALYCVSEIACVQVEE